MKYLLYLLFCSSGFAQPRFLADIIRNDKQTISKNQIAKEKIYSYQASKKGIKDSILEQVNYCNVLGYLIRSTRGPDETAPKMVVRYRYLINNSGELLKKIEDDSSLNIAANQEFFYDSLQRKVLQYFYNKDTSILSVEKEIYDSADHLVQALTSGDNKEFYISRRYYYDDNDSLAKEDAFDAKGSNTFSFIYEYDTANRSRRQYLVNADGKTLAQEDVYNFTKQVIKKERVINSATDEVEEYLYNDNGTEFQCAITINGKPVKLYRHYYFR